MSGIKIEIVDQRGIWKAYESCVVPRAGELIYVNDKMKWFKVGQVIHGTNNDVTISCEEVDIDQERYYD